jgi:hypothetical protein
MNNFLKVLKIKSVLSVYAQIVFKFFCCLVMEKIKDEVKACFYMKTLTNCENPSSNPLQTACFGIQKPAYDSVNC